MVKFSCPKPLLPVEAFLRELPVHPTDTSEPTADRVVEYLEAYQVDASPNIYLIPSSSLSRFRPLRFPSLKFQLVASEDPAWWYLIIRTPTVMHGRTVGFLAVLASITTAFQPSFKNARARARARTRVAMAFED
ncbi:hypothetical protein JCM8097_006111, partial [Rhodosporidiobolus ruineniae]